MIGFLRCIGLLNAAVWFGAGVFFTFLGGPALFSEDMKALLEKFYPYYSGAIAQIVIARYFRLEIVCSVIAILHLLGEQFYFGRAPQKRWRALLLVLLALSFLGKFWLEPKLEKLHTTKYASNASPELREAASASFRTWHGISQVTNLFMLAGLGFYVVRVGTPREMTHFIGAGKFRS